MKSGPKPRATIDRFEEKYIPVTESGCWIWIGATYTNGYGIMRAEHKKLDSAHRISYRLNIGPIPQGMWVLHKCDVRCCVNPDHLFLGTHQDNMDDMTSKNRHKYGENSHLATLTKKQVKSIKYSNEKQSVLAARYGVVQQTISKIKTKRNWKTII